MSRFNVTEARAMRDLTNTMLRWGVEEWDVDRYRGRHRASMAPEQRRVTVWFVLPGRGRLEVSCDQWNTPTENLRACWYAIDSVRLNELRGVGAIAASAYLQIAATDPYAVLGLDAGASEAAVEAAFKRLAKEHHPDTGGDADEFKRVTAAYEALT